ncbi:conjugative transfer pilus assembly protein TraH [Massilia violacea]|uniref:Conjugative transfer pilus assembly protein TraH n=2 Tax=Pseudoduganella violacea TaxID=1715466 RepID=A0A7W5FWR9_9BURK|nr:conjugative transfer pilus assembly protein TraH [Pseudoduganella violacea]
MAAAGVLCGALAPAVTQAGDLNAAVEQMYQDLGAIGNYTAPGAFRGQVYNTYTGGSIIMRTQNRTYQLMAVEFPSMKAGCGGIDAFGGSFSHISAAEFKNMLRNITAALPGVAFQLALESVSPLLGGVTKWTKNIESMMTNANIGTCNAAKSLVGSAMEATGVSTDKACEDLAVMLGLESDYAAAKVRCQSNKPGVLSTARNSADPKIRNKAPFVGNITWKALKLAGTQLDDQERELIMSIVGTVIFYEGTRDPNPVAPTLTSIGRLLYGTSAAPGGKVKQDMLRCNNYTDCDVVTVDTNYLHTPFVTKVEGLMRSITEKMQWRVPIPNNSPEIGFVNQTSEPVYRMLSLGTAMPSMDVSDQLIARFRELIAADYAQVLLEKNLRLGMYVLDKDYALDVKQSVRTKELRQRAQEMLTQLAQEKSLLYQRSGHIESVTSTLEALQRELRSSMPQYMLDLLGRRAAYLR